MAIEKSYVDMIKERDVKIEALRELLKLSHEKLGSQSDMIAELKSNILMLEQYNGSVESLIKDIKAHNLEQQALACDWIYTKLPNYSSENLSVITARRLELVTQANALKEQE
jgi:Mg2+ and Co2+ transporter CorA